MSNMVDWCDSSDFSTVQWWIQMCIFWPFSASECLQFWVDIPQYGSHSPLVTNLYLLTSFRLRMLAICSEQEFYKRARRLSCRGEYCIFCIFWQILTRGLGPERSWNLSFIRVVQNRRFRSKYPPTFFLYICSENNFENLTSFHDKRKVWGNIFTR